MQNVGLDPNLVVNCIFPCISIEDKYLLTRSVYLRSSIVRKAYSRALFLETFGALASFEHDIYSTAREIRAILKPNKSSRDIQELPSPPIWYEKLALLVKDFEGRNPESIYENLCLIRRHQVIEKMNKIIRENIPFITFNLNINFTTNSFFEIGQLFELQTSIKAQVSVYFDALLKVSYFYIKDRTNVGSCCIYRRDNMLYAQYTALNTIVSPFLTRIVLEVFLANKTSTLCLDTLFSLDATRIRQIKFDHKNLSLPMIESRQSMPAQKFSVLSVAQALLFLRDP